MDSPNALRTLLLLPLLALAACATTDQEHWNPLREFTDAQARYAALAKEENALALRSRAPAFEIDPAIASNWPEGRVKHLAAEVPPEEAVRFYWGYRDIVETTGRIPRGYFGHREILRALALWRTGFFGNVVRGKWSAEDHRRILEACDIAIAKRKELGLQLPPHQEFVLRAMPNLLRYERAYLRVLWADEDGSLKRPVVIEVIEEMAAAEKGIAESPAGKNPRLFARASLTRYTILRNATSLYHRFEFKDDDAAQWLPDFAERVRLFRADEDAQRALADEGMTDAASGLVPLP